MLYYSQRDGLWGDPAGAVIALSAPCIAGNNEQGRDLNNPASEYLHDRGPLPTGTYTIGVLKQQPDVHSQGCTLTPDPGNYMGPVPRSGFFLHLRNSAHVAPDGTNASSNGCPTFANYQDLFELWANWVHKRGESRMRVVATTDEFPNASTALAVDRAPIPGAAATPPPPPPLPPPPPTPPFGVSDE